MENFYARVNYRCHRIQQLLIQCRGMEFGEKIFSVYALHLANLSFEMILVWKNEHDEIIKDLPLVRKHFQSRVTKSSATTETCWGVEKHTKHTEFREWRVRYNRVRVYV